MGLHDRGPVPMEPRTKRAGAHPRRAPWPLRGIACDQDPGSGADMVLEQPLTVAKIAELTGIQYGGVSRNEIPPADCSRARFGAGT